MREVLAGTDGGGSVRVRADTVIVAAGALLTPLLLRRNGLGTASGQLGRNLSIHPASAARAVYDEVVDPWAGVPQSVYVDELAGDGIMLEGIAGPPDQGAMSTPRTGAEHRDLMLAARRNGSFGVMVSDTARGSVRSRSRAAWSCATTCTPTTPSASGAASSCWRGSSSRRARAR